MRIAVDWLLLSDIGEVIELDIRWMAALNFEAEDIDVETLRCLDILHVFHNESESGFIAHDRYCLLLDVVS